ncbi:hypothetical protein EAI06_04030 [Limosilactobacillus reuteri]|nr:hypothetical protein EAI06_04030 [Limosilactobacillus reuteri]
MIPDVTPNGVFYLPPTGWLTSFYNPPVLQKLTNVDLTKYFKIKPLSLKFSLTVFYFKSFYCKKANYH